MAPNLRSGNKLIKTVALVNSNKHPAINQPTNTKNTTNLKANTKHNPKLWNTYNFTTSTPQKTTSSECVNALNVIWHPSPFLHVPNNTAELNASNS